MKSALSKPLRANMAAIVASLWPASVLAEPPEPTGTVKPSDKPSFNPFAGHKPS